MPTVIRWIAFDSETAAAIDSLVGQGSTEVQAGDPLETALNLSNSSIVVLPSSTPGKVVLACFRATPAKETAKAAALAFEPSGFLGLSDTPVLSDETPPATPKKRWWQRKQAA
jgi:hypothetical protein